MAKKKSRRKAPASKQRTRSAPPAGKKKSAPSAKAQAPVPGAKKQQRSAVRAVAAQKKQKRQTFLIWSVLGVVLVGVLAASILFGGGASGVSETDAWDLPAMGDTADTQERVTLAEFAGTPTVVNFFASWCIECDRELPIFATVSRQLEGQVDFVGVASAETGNPLFMPEKHGVDWWPLARDVGPRGNDLAVALGAFPGSMPLTAFYDENGTLLNVQPGSINEATLRGNITQFYGIEF